GSSSNSSSGATSRSAIPAEPTGAYTRVPSSIVSDSSTRPAASRPITDGTGGAPARCLPPATHRSTGLSGAAVTSISDCPGPRRAPVALLLPLARGERRRREPQHVEGADQVHADHGLERLKLGGPVLPHGPLGPADARARHAEAQPAERLHGTLHGGLHLVLV